MKGIVLLNMGGARSKEELKTFLLNMFNDKNILTLKNDTIRSILASLITFFRIDNAWQNYEAIGGSSPLHNITQKIVDKLQDELGNKYYVTFAFRYTPPFSDVAIARLKELNIKYDLKGGKGVKIIMITTEGGKEEVLTGLANGVNSYIVKPFNIDKMREKLQELKMI